MKISEKIIEYRMKHKLTQTAFAKLCNITRQSVYNVEHELHQPSTLLYAKILKVIKEGKEE